MPCLGHSKSLIVVDAIIWAPENGGNTPPEKPEPINKDTKLSQKWDDLEFQL